MENWLVSSVGEVFKSMKKVSKFYGTTIAFATSTTSTHCSKPPGVLRVTHFSQRWGIWKDIWLLVVILLNIITQRMFTNWEKRFLKSWMHSTSHIQMSKTCSKSWQCVIFSPFVSRKKTHTGKLRLQRGSGSMSIISFYLVKLDPGTQFSLQRQSPLSHFVFYHCSRRISNSKQSSDQIEFYWTRDCNQDKTVCYTGTTQPKMQPSREGVKICRWLCRGRGKGFIYTFLADAKKSIIWLTGKFWAHTVTFYQSLDSTAKNTILFWSSRICYQFL